MVCASSILNPICDAREKLCGVGFEYLNSNVPVFEGLVTMMNLKNQIANMDSQEKLHQSWSSISAINQFQESNTGVALHNQSPATWFVLIYNHCCHIFQQAVDESHVELGERVLKMVSTGQIRLRKLTMNPDGDLTRHRLGKNCSLYHLNSNILCNFTAANPLNIQILLCKASHCYTDGFVC